MNQYFRYIFIYKLDANGKIYKVLIYKDRMQPKAYKELEKISSNIYDVCLEKEHLNMVVTKIIGMVARGKIKKLVFATVDKSPHCVQLHYVIKELENAIDISNIEIINYVAVDNKLIEIPIGIISLSKNLSKLKETK